MATEGLQKLVGELTRALRDGALRNVRFSHDTFERAAVQAELRELHRTGRAPERARVFVDAIAALAEEVPKIEAALRAAEPSDATAAALALFAVPPPQNPALRLLFFAQYDELLARRGQSR
jgi:hypothetical protein